MRQDRLLCTAAFRLNVPPSYDKYLEWGFSDGSVRFYAADSKKVFFFPLLYRSPGNTYNLNNSFLAILNIYTLANCRVRFSQTRKHSLQPDLTALFRYGHSSLITDPWSCRLKHACLVIGLLYRCLLHLGRLAPFCLPH